MNDSNEFETGDPTSRHDMFDVQPIDVQPQTLHYLLEHYGVRDLGDAKLPAIYEVPFADKISAEKQLKKHLEDPVETLLLLGGSRLQTGRMAGMVEQFKNKPMLCERRRIALSPADIFPFADGHVRLDQATGRFSFTPDPEMEAMTRARGEVIADNPDSLTVINEAFGLRIKAHMQNQPEIIEEHLMQLGDDDQQWFMQLNQAFAQYQDRMCERVVAVLSEDEIAVLRRAFTLKLPDNERHSTTEQAREIVYSAQATHDMFDAAARAELLAHVRNIQSWLRPVRHPLYPSDVETLGSGRVKGRVSRYFTELINRAATQTPPGA